MVNVCVRFRFFIFVDEQWKGFRGDDLKMKRISIKTYVHHRVVAVLEEGEHAHAVSAVVRVAGGDLAQQLHLFHGGLAHQVVVADELDGHKRAVRAVQAAEHRGEDALAQRASNLEETTGRQTREQVNEGGLGGGKKGEGGKFCKKRKEEEG